MARLAVSAASCTLTAGLKPPLGIFITRASASVVLTRGCRFRICWPGLLHHHRYLTTFRPPQPHRCLGFLCLCMAHVFLIACIDLENLLHIPESIEKVTGSRMTVL
jgi:hypothetical protein